MDVDLNLPIPPPTRDASGNAIWLPSGVLAGAPAGSPMPVAPSGVPIYFRHIAWLLFCGIFGGIAVGLLASFGTLVFTKSKFVIGIVLGSALYGSLILGYHWSAQERNWIGLRGRFTFVGRKPLLLGALTAPALIAVTTMLGFILKAIGINIKDVPGAVTTPPSLGPTAICSLSYRHSCPNLRGAVLSWLAPRLAPANNECLGCRHNLERRILIASLKPLLARRRRMASLFPSLPNWDQRIRSRN